MKEVWASLSFSDKVAGAALLLAIVSIVLSTWTMREQHRQWRATSLARVELVDAGFVYWRTLSLEAARATAWGYSALFAMQMKDRIVTGHYLLMNRLVVRDRASGRLIEDLAGVTVAELQAELQRRQIALQDVEFQQHFQMEFDSQNLGQSAAQRLQVEILGFLSDQDRWSSLGTSQPVDLGPGKRVQNMANLWVGLGAELPARLKVRLRVTYITADGDTVEADQPLYYLRDDAAWKFGQ